MGMADKQGDKAFQESASGGGAPTEEMQENTKQDGNIANLKVLPLVGLKSLRAFNVYHTLLLGYKMLPAKIGMTYEDFLTEFYEIDQKEKEKVLRQAIAFVPIEQEELDALTCFCCDTNDIPLTKINTKGMTPKELIDVVVAVCLELSKIKLYSINEDVKKN
jgi:hypothetical protein